MVLNILETIPNNDKARTYLSQCWMRKGDEIVYVTSVDEEAPTLQYFTREGYLKADVFYERVEPHECEFSDLSLAPMSFGYCNIPAQCNGSRKPYVLRVSRRPSRQWKWGVRSNNLHITGLDRDANDSHRFPVLPVLGGFLRMINNDYPNEPHEEGFTALSSHWATHADGDMYHFFFDKPVGKSGVLKPEYEFLKESWEEEIADR